MKQRIHDDFHVSLLEQIITRKGWVDDENNVAKLEAGNKNGEYEMEAIQNSAVYMRESEFGHLLGLYYLVSWKRYLKKKNTWEPASAMQYLRKLISSFHKNHPEKPTATSPAIDTVSPVARPTTKPTKPLKKKQKQLTKCVKKCIKWGDKEELTKRNSN